MTDLDGPPQLGLLDNELRRLQSLSEQLHTTEHGVGRVWLDFWTGPASAAFGKIRDRLAARPGRVGDLVDDAIGALRNYREVLTERPAPSASANVLTEWRQRLAAAGMSAADQLRLISRELAELPPILGEPAPNPRPTNETGESRSQAAGKRSKQAKSEVSADLPSHSDRTFPDQTAEVCDEVLDGDFGELDEPE